ncbi:elongation factor-like GTPase 1 [Centruroides sculpturatus]|uniref:elongation factor-like GTPase 1 n=1 Tax=Centruroides sculpturatus TaxID=218467 RepID=UPI000C6EF2F5|nr:elongation factor-like GTPase 1 [Centruroides sculpturatus]
MRTITIEELSNLQKNPHNIRNVCILAHVDHGKTTLADCILASNGIISQRMAGKLRYLDSRKDEQERGITMKCSSVSIHHKIGEEDYLINLIDSPGHVDFYGEVSTAVRLCDGAILVVDVIEGVCAQTKIALCQAWTENIRPVLVLNKIDRLILERKMTPLDAYVHLQQVLEQVNVVTAELFTSDILEKFQTESVLNDKGEKNSTTDQTYDWNSGIDDTDDSTVYFSPEQNNVIFASAIDGWGFGISHFAKLYSTKLGIKEDILNKTLWGDYYLNTKTKRIMKGAQAKAKKPLFVQFVLENIWAVYEAVVIKRNKEMIDKIVKSLDLKIAPRDSKHSDSRVQLQAICSQWLSLPKAVLDMLCNIIPSPASLSSERVECLMCTSTHRFDSLPSQTQDLKKDFLACSSSPDAPVVVCVSKMFSVDKKALPQNKIRPLTTEEIAQRREEARQRHMERMTADKNINSMNDKNDQKKLDDINTLESPNQDEEVVFIAFARIFSGKLYKGQTLYVLGPKHDPTKILEKNIEINKNLTLKDLPSDQHITIATIKDLYLLMGKELVSLDSVPAGNVVGISGLEDHVLKSATLSTTIVCSPFVELQTPITPILRVALEPSHPSEMSSLVSGLRLLNQADPCVQVLIQETGEHVIVTAGEVHLERCLDDLKERFAKIEINVSPPIVPFRETIVPPPKTDMVNEIIEDKNQIKKLSDLDGDSGSDGLITIQTPNKRSIISLRAIPLPECVTKLIEENSQYIKALYKTVNAQRSKQATSVDILTSETLKKIEDLKHRLEVMFNEEGPTWKNAVDQIWSFGPKRCGPNILLNRIPGYKQPSVWIEKKDKLLESIFLQYDNSFVNGFQLATLSGPLCQEPMMGVCFIVENWEIDNLLNEIDTTVNLQLTDKLENQNVDSAVNCNGDSIFIGDSDTREDLNNSELVGNYSEIDNSNAPYGPLAGQIMSIMKEGCRRAFQAQPQRLMVAMYSCNIQVTAEMLGKMYAVLGRRHGRILHSDMREGCQTFDITAVLPIAESFDFANEIRKQTSGMACPQLLFSHWDILDLDPFWVPTTEEEYLHFGEKADTENRARKYMNAVRRRKGLAVDEKIVEHAEKQRTLTKNK